jgi:hypothetical protein
MNQDEYKDYLGSRDYISNTRIRPDDEDFFDWIMSPDADMSKTPEGRAIITAIQNLHD